MEKWTMIFNPASASESTKDKWKESLDILSAASLEIETLATEYASHAIELAMEAAQKGARKFIAVGGDGTIHEVMTGLLRFSDQEGVNLGEFTLAVLPYGTGNDWIRTAGIPADMTESAKCIIKGNTAKEDVVRLSFDNGVYCMANIGGIGLDADICYNTNCLKKKGYKGEFLYKMVAPFSIFTKVRRKASIEIDGEQVYSGSIFTIVLGNGLYRGGGLRQTQEGGRWDDGLMEVSIQKGVNHIKALSQMMHIFTGDFAVLDGIITRRCKKMTVKPLDRRADRVEADGEIPGTLPLTVEVTGQQINIIVP